jgi:serine kinase of HPr protein (carbohydrate metabolism regulator)
MMENPSQKIHATCISVEGTGLLFRGPSGSGKSDLALRMMEHNSQLIADDWVDLTLQGDVLIAQAPIRLKGLLEVRGVGIIEVPYGISIRVLGVIDLVDSNKIQRLPVHQTAILLGVKIPIYQINPWEISAIAKVQLVRDLISGSIIRNDD